MSKDFGILWLCPKDCGSSVITSKNWYEGECPSCGSEYEEATIERKVDWLNKQIAKESQKIQRMKNEIVLLNHEKQRRMGVVENLKNLPIHAETMGGSPIKCHKCNSHVFKGISYVDYEYNNVTLHCAKCKEPSRQSVVRFIPQDEEVYGGECWNVI